MWGIFLLTFALRKNARELGVVRVQFYAGVNGLKKKRTKQNKETLSFQIFTE